MRVNRLIFAITGTQNDVLMRPFNAHMSSDISGAFIDATLGGSNTSVHALSKVAHDILRPQTESAGSVAIANTFSERRMQFLMEVDHGGGNRQVISGYTDHVGITPTGSIDPRMRMFINQSMSLRDATVQTPGYAPRIQSQIKDASHYLAPTAPSESTLLHGVGAQTTVTMRPSDIVESFDMIDEVNSYMSSYGESTIDTENLLVANGDSTFNTGLRKSSLKNGHSAHYLSNVVSAMNQASELTDPASDWESVNSNAASYLADATISSDRFINNTVQSGLTLSQGGSCTWQELIMACPEAAHVSNISDLSARMMALPVHDNRGTAEHWNGTTQETSIATIISNSLPGIMIDNALTTLDVTITTCINGTQNGAVLDQPGFVPQAQLGINVTISNANSITGASIEQLRDVVPLIEQRIAGTIAMEISHNGEIPVMAHAQINLFGENTIGVAYNYGPVIQYVNPQYCSAAYSPVMATSHNNATNIAKNLSELCNLNSVALVAPEAIYV